MPKFKEWIDHERTDLTRKVTIQNYFHFVLLHAYSRTSKFNFIGFRNRQTPDNSTGSRTIEISNSNRYRKQLNWRPERERNCATNVMGDKFRSNYTDDQSVSTANKGFHNFLSF